MIVELSEVYCFSEPPPIVIIFGEIDELASLGNAFLSKKIIDLKKDFNADFVGNIKNLIISCSQPQHLIIFKEKIASISLMRENMNIAGNIIKNLYTYNRFAYIEFDKENFREDALLIVSTPTPSMRKLSL